MDKLTPTSKYVIDYDTWLARHGQCWSLERSARARLARIELNLFQIGKLRHIIDKHRQIHEAKAKATPHPKFTHICR